jgi:hypothetical protein
VTISDFDISTVGDPVGTNTPCGGVGVGVRNAEGELVGIGVKDADVKAAGDD